MISIIAHRGYSSRYRENSPEAWQRAVEAGADFIEIDVRFTADWQGVCLHDADLVRLAGRAKRIADLPYAEIEAIEVDGQPVAPRLLTAFETIPLSTGIMLDVKDERPEALAMLHELIGTAGRRIVLGLHDAESVATMKAFGRESLLALMPDPAMAPAFLEAGCSIVRLWEADATAERLTAAAERNVPVWVTAGGGRTGRGVGDIEAKDLVALAAMGVSGVLVNDPAAARADLQQFADPKFLKDRFL